MSDNDFKNLQWFYQVCVMGNDRCYCNFSDIGNYVTLKSTTNNNDSWFNKRKYNIRKGFL